MSRRIRRPHLSGGTPIPTVAEAMECDQETQMDVSAPTLQQQQQQPPQQQQQPQQLPLLQPQPH